MGITAKLEPLVPELQEYSHQFVALERDAQRVLAGLEVPQHLWQAAKVRERLGSTGVAA